jgi:ACS family tartrate transporter-like MFS transporter
VDLDGELGHRARSFVPLSVVLGSPLSGALLELNGIGGLKGRQWLFIIESVPAVISGIVVLFYMTDMPEKAKWLADDERAWLVEAMNAERAKRAATHTTASGAASPMCACSRCRSCTSERPLVSTPLGIWAPQIIRGSA